MGVEELKQILLIDLALLLLGHSRCLPADDRLLEERDAFILGVICRGSGDAAHEAGVLTAVGTAAGLVCAGIRAAIAVCIDLVGDESCYPQLSDQRTHRRARMLVRTEKVRPAHVNHCVLPGSASPAYQSTKRRPRKLQTSATPNRIGAALRDVPEVSIVGWRPGGNESMWKTHQFRSPSNGIGRETSSTGNNPWIPPRSASRRHGDGARCRVHGDGSFGVGADNGDPIGKGESPSRVGRASDPGGVGVLAVWRHGEGLKGSCVESRCGGCLVPDAMIREISSRV